MQRTVSEVDVLGSSGDFLYGGRGWGTCKDTYIIVHTLLIANNYYTRSSGYNVYTYYVYTYNEAHSTYRSGQFTRNAANIFLIFFAGNFVPCSV